MPDLVSVGEMWNSTRVQILRFGRRFSARVTELLVANGGTWLNPTTILGPRFVRLNFTFNF